MNTEENSCNKVLSCGVLIQSPDGWLLAHATRTRRWDIPKGKMDPGETPIETALRETREEIGVDLSDAKDRLVDLGRHPYLPKKDLHLFTLSVPHAFSLEKCACSTLIKVDGEDLPETDEYRWIPAEKARQYIGKGLASYLTARGLLAPESCLRCRSKIKR